jgi:hypothetical protein
MGEVNASLPSIVIGAKDADGKDILDLKVSIDGTLVTEHLGGRALPIDPGRHKMRYEKEDGAVVEEDILVGEGTKNREVSVVFPSLKSGATSSAGGTTAPTTEGKGPSTGNTVFGTVLSVVGAGALATALALDVSTNSSVTALRNSPCGTHVPPDCSASQVSGFELDYDMAGVALGVGIVAIGVATWVFIAHPLGTPASGPSQTAKPTFRVVPSPHGSGFAITF